MKSLLTLNRYLFKYRWRLLLGIFFVFASILFGILPAKIVQRAIDEVLNAATSGNTGADEISKMAILYGLLVIGMALARGLLMFFMRQTLIVMSRLIEFDLKNEIFAQYQRLSLSFYRQNNTGDLMARISEDVSRVRMYLGPVIMYTANLVFTFIMCVVVMITVDPMMTLFVMLPIPLISYSIYKVNSSINRRSDQIQAQLSTLHGFAQEAYSGIRILKSFAALPNSQRLLDKELKTYEQLNLGLAKVEGLFMPLTGLLVGLSTISTVLIGGFGVINGHITYGNIAEFVLYVNLLTWPVAALGWSTTLIQRAEASMARINEFLNTNPEIRADLPGLAPRMEHGIRFDKVSFHYPNKEEYALRSVTFDIPKGKVIGVVGPVGSGKTTLAQLLLRFYDPTEGQILVDGQPLPRLDLRKFRAMASYVPQDVFLFSDTIEENIALGTRRTENLPQRIEQAARQAAVYDNIVGFPDGFKTILGERGITLSGGQKQRVAIARALVDEPDLLVLDDCLSAVDMVTEHAILDSFRQVFKKTTVFIISHRVSSVMNADEILVLEQGAITERGTHQQLVTSGGYYAALYQMQQEESRAVNPS